MKLTLILIAAFFLGVVLSFVWFVATWDPSMEDPVSVLSQPQQEAQA